MDHLADILSEIDRAGKASKTGMLEKIGRKIFVLILLGAVLSAMAAFVGGSLHHVGRNLAMVLDTASTGAGLVVRSVETPGLEADARETILQQAGITPGLTTMRSANPHRIKERLGNINSVGRVQVSRHWPHHLIIVVEPRQAKALLDTGSGWAVIDRHGQILPADSEQTGLPRLNRVEDKAAITAILTELDAIPELAGKVTHLERIGERRWNMWLVSGACLLLPEAAGERREALRSVIKLNVLDLGPVRIDSRSGQHMALRWPPRSEKGA